MDFSIKDIDYPEVETLWRQDLWPDRQDPIRPMSSMVLGGGVDMNIYKTYVPYFSGLYFGAELIGVLSGHAVSDSQFRIRGLYIKQPHRGRGGTRLLFNEMKTKALNQGCSLIWSYPRLSALPVYQKFGFKTYPSNQHDDNHIYVFLNADM